MLEKLNSYFEAGLVYKQVHPTLPLIIWNYSEKVQYENLWDDITLQTNQTIQPNIFLPRRTGLVADDVMQRISAPSSASSIDLTACTVSRSTIKTRKMRTSRASWNENYCDKTQGGGKEKGNVIIDHNWTARDHHFNDSPIWLKWKQMPRTMDPSFLTETLS